VVKRFAAAPSTSSTSSCAASAPRSRVPSLQAPERDDVLNVGGFADPVFDLVAEFAKGTLGGDHWLGVIQRVEL
jgi:hypothetical protein